MRELSHVLLVLHLIGGEGTVYSDWLINVFKVFVSVCELKNKLTSLLTKCLLWYLASVNLFIRGSFLSVHIPKLIYNC